jgi:hypothetical protein
MKKVNKVKVIKSSVMDRINQEIDSYNYNQILNEYLQPNMNHMRLV